MLTKIRSPFDELEIFTNFFNDKPFFNDFRKLENTPKINIKENEKDFQVEVSAPGYKKEDFKLNVEKDILTLSVEKSQTTEDKKDSYYRKEFSQSSFQKSFSLNDEINKEKINASYNNGILYITLEKKEKELPKLKSIEVQ